MNGRPHRARALAQWLLGPEEWLFTRLAGSRPVAGSKGTFLVAYHRHHGAAVHLPDGTVVRPGDPIAEIHFWNDHIARRREAEAGAVTWHLVRDFRADLGTLAQAMARREIAPRAKAVYGAGPIAPAAARFGFFVRPLPPGLRRSALTGWQHMIRRAFRPPGVVQHTDAETSELWMSRAELLRRFAAGHAPHAAERKPRSDPNLSQTPHRTGPSAGG